MTKAIYTFILFFPFLFISCSDDKSEIDIDEPTSNNSLHVTYKVTSSHPTMTELYISYNDSQGNYIVKTVESGWTYKAKLPKGKKAFLSSAVDVKDEFLEILNINDCSTTAQIIQKDEVIKSAEGFSIVVELEP